MTTNFIPLGITNMYHATRAPRPLTTGARPDRETFRGPIAEPALPGGRPAFGLQTVSGGPVRFGARWRGAQPLFGNRLNYLA
jgi:hypothetical protein